MMKKAAVLFFSVLFLLSATACSGKKNGDSKEFDYLNLEYSDYLTLGKYRGLEIDMTPEPTQQEIDDAISRLLLKYEATEQIKDRAAANGDTVNIDFIGYMDGVAFQGGTGTDYPLTLGSHQFIEGFEEGLVGVMPGSTVSLDLSFPNPYKPNPDFAGKPVTFDVTVNWIEEYSYPDYTDEFVQQISDDYETTADYTRYITESIAQEKADDMLAYKANYLLEQVYYDTEIKQYPQAELDYYYNDMVNYYADMANDYNLELGQLMQYYYGITEEEFYSEASEYANEAVAGNLIVAAIANLEGISLTDEEYDADLEELASTNGYEVDELKGMYSTSFFKMRFIKEKVLDLIDSCSVTID